MTRRDKGWQRARTVIDLKDRTYSRSQRFGTVILAQALALRAIVHGCYRPGLRGQDMRKEWEEGHQQVWRRVGFANCHAVPCSVTIASRMRVRRLIGWFEQERSPEAQWPSTRTEINTMLSTRPISLNADIDAPTHTISNTKTPGRKGSKGRNALQENAILQGPKTVLTKKNVLQTPFRPGTARRS